MWWNKSKNSTDAELIKNQLEEIRKLKQELRLEKRKVASKEEVNIRNQAARKALHNQVRDASEQNQQQVFIISLIAEETKRHAAIVKFIARHGRRPTTDEVNAELLYATSTVGFVSGTCAPSLFDYSRPAYEL